MTDAANNPAHFSANDCIFCKIARGEIPSTFLYQDNDIVAFRDSSPVAPTHVLIVPRKHMVSVADVDDATAPMMGKAIQVAAQIARMENVEASGYRLLTNAGPDGGQVVMHLHWHLIGGRKLGKLG